MSNNNTKPTWLFRWGRRPVDEPTAEEQREEKELQETIRRALEDREKEGLIGGSE